MKTSTEFRARISSDIRDWDDIEFEGYSLPGWDVL
jgi:hypothetical protein